MLQVLNMFTYNVFTYYENMWNNSMFESSAYKILKIFHKALSL